MVDTGRRRSDAFYGTLAEQEDGVGVCSSRVATHPGGRVQAFTATDQKDLLLHGNTKHFFDRFLQLWNATHEWREKIKLFKYREQP